MDDLGFIAMLWPDSELESQNLAFVDHSGAVWVDYVQIGAQLGPPWPVLEASEPQAVSVSDDLL